MEIAVISGKGGTGKSTISAAFATLNGKVILADCDVDAANLYLLFNPSHKEEVIYIGGTKAEIDYSKCTNCRLCIGYCRFDAITDADDKVVISEILCDGCVLCSRICPEKAITMVANEKSRMFSGSFSNGEIVYGRLSPGEENTGKLVNMVREKAKQLSRETGIETIIIDGPPGIGCPVISSLTGTNKAVMVTEPTISGLNDLKRIRVLVKKFKLEEYVIINKSDLNDSMSSRIKKWCKENGITVAGTLPFDREIVDALVQGKSITELYPDSTTAKKIKKIWNKIINQKR